MKYSLTIDIDLEKDSRIDLKIYAHAQDMHGAIWDSRQLIRSRMKYENISEEEYKFLEELSKELYVEGLDF